MTVFLEALVALVLACVLLPATSSPAHAAEADGSVFQAGGLWYTVTSSSAAEVGVGRQGTAGGEFAASKGAVSIPAHVEHDGVTYSVTSVSNYAFSDGSAGADISSVTMAEGVKRIGAFAFCHCDELESVDIPTSVTYINRRAFAYCPKLASIAFEDAGSTSPSLECLDGTFAGSANRDLALKEVTLPARLHYISEGMFENQHALERVMFAGTSTSYIAPRAFDYCSSIRYLEVPQLVFNGGAAAPSLSLDGSGTRVGTNAFRGLNKLETIVFMGDEDFGAVASSASVKKVVYRGTHENTGYAGATRYNTVYFHSTEQDAEAGTGLAGHVCVSDEVAVKDITPKLDVGDADIVYEGSVPDPGQGSAWYFPGMSVIGPLSNTVHAYRVAESDLGYGHIELDRDSFVYDGAPQDLSCSVYDVTGRLLGAEAYTLGVLDAKGREVGLRDAVDAGAYTVYAKAKGGSGYTGTATAEVEVASAACTWTRMSGNALYSTLNHVAEAAFTVADVDTVVLVGRTHWARGAAAAGLAGVRGAPVVVTDDAALSLEARGNLNRYGPAHVILVGIEESARRSVADAVEDQTDTALESVSTSLDADSDAETAARILSKTDYWDGCEEAVVASAADPSTLLAAAAYAYAAQVPVLLVDDAGKLPATALEALAEHDFGRIVLAGPQDAVPASVAGQLEAAGCTGAVERWGASGSYAGSADVAAHAVEEGVLDYDKLMLHSLSDTEYGVMGAAASGKNGAVLLAADDTPAGRLALDDVLAPNRYRISTGFVLGTRASLPQRFLEDIQALWSLGSERDLNLGSVTLDADAFVESGAAVEVSATVRDANGAVVDPAQYSLSFYNDATDATVRAAKLAAAGKYTVTATGKGTVADGFYNSCSTTLEITTPAPQKGKVKLTLNTAKVTAGSIAAKDAKTVKAIVLGPKVKSIGAKAFSKCAKLASVTLGKAVTSIGAGAFKGCAKLKTVTVKTAKLTAKRVSGCLSGSKVKTVKVSAGSKKASKTLVKKYKKVFKKANSGRSVTVK